MNKVTREEQEAIARNFSFDVLLMHKRLDSGDDFQRIIQAHLFIDHILTQILSEELKKPDSIALDRMTIASKADLAVAMGIVEDDIYRPFKRINRIRNAIAHDLNYKIPEGLAKEVRDLLPSRLRKLVDDAEITEASSKLGRALKVFILALDIVRQRQQKLRDFQAAQLEKFKEFKAEAQSIVADLDARNAK